MLLSRCPSFSPVRSTIYIPVAPVYLPIALSFFLLQIFISQSPVTAALTVKEPSYLHLPVYSILFTRGGLRGLHVAAAHLKVDDEVQAFQFQSPFTMLSRGYSVLDIGTLRLVTCYRPLRSNCCRGALQTGRSEEPSIVRK